MKIEILIYAYLAVCTAMIIFNIVCIFLFSYKDKAISSGRHDFIRLIRPELEKDFVSSEHKEMLLKRLVHVNELMSFDRSLEMLLRAAPVKTREYLQRLDTVFIRLTEEYSKKSEVQAAYFPYLIYHYGLFRGKDHPQVNSVLMSLLSSPSVYSRENALEAIYSFGNPDTVVEALLLIDNNGYYDHRKLITDGLMNYAGDSRELAHKFIDHLNRFSLDMQIAVLDFIRFKISDFCEEMYDFLSNKYDSEINYCAIRYFGRNYYEPAYDKLISFVENEDDIQWEYTAISCQALGIYPGERTAELLKSKLSSRNWYVRLNAAKTLHRLGLEYVDLIDVIQGDDRFASEIMSYQFAHKKIQEGG